MGDTVIATDRVVVGAVRGFTVLLVGELVAVLVASVVAVPTLLLLLQVVAAAGFVLAARHLGSYVEAILAAAGAYGLTIPLSALGGAIPSPARAVGTLLVAAVVAALTHRLAGHGREP